MMCDADTRKVKVEIEFEIGTLEQQLGYGSFKQSWIDSELDGRDYSLTCGAGLGNDLIEASITEGKRSLYARASIVPVATGIFNALTAALKGEPDGDGS
jgi:hypothetical protein